MKRFFVTMRCLLLDGERVPKAGENCGGEIDAGDGALLVHLAVAGGGRR